MRLSSLIVSFGALSLTLLPLSEHPRLFLFLLSPLWDPHEQRKHTCHRVTEQWLMVDAAHFYVHLTRKKEREMFLSLSLPACVCVSAKSAWLWNVKNFVIKSTRAVVYESWEKKRRGAQVVWIHVWEMQEKEAWQNTYGFLVKQWSAGCKMFFNVRCSLWAMCNCCCCCCCGAFLAESLSPCELLDGCQILNKEKSRRGMIERRREEKKRPKRERRAQLKSLIHNHSVRPV